MLGKKALLIFWAVLAAAADFNGQAAYDFTAQAVSYGPRPPGSKELAALRSSIMAFLKKLPCSISEDSFTASTPAGPIGMSNIVALFAGSSGRAVAVTGHYDTKVFKDFRFVGANDGGSSTGFLMELARVLASRPHKDDIYLVWFDGEEAIEEWSAEDGLYGSRHLARRWQHDGTLSRLKALINVDMIGDRDLGLGMDSFSSPEIGRLVWRVAADLGYGRHFLRKAIAVEDDHTPFARLGVRVLDLIDFDYGPANSWWHTSEDKLDKLDPRSFQVVGEVVLETLWRLEQQ